MSIKSIDTERRTITYYLEGNLNSEETLLFLNGLYVGKNSWVKQYRYPYFRKSYKMIFIDYPGVGLSEEKVDKSFSFDDIIDDIKYILDVENCKRSHLICYSVGGMLGIWFASKYRESVKSLVLMNSGVSVNFYFEKMIEALMNIIKEEVSLEKVFMFLYPWNHSEEYLRKVSDMQEQTLKSYSEYNKNTKSFYRLLEAIKDRPNLAEVLGNINVPALIITGDEDKIFPMTYQKELASGIKGSVHLSIANSGHASFIEKYQEVNEYIMEHLKRQAICK
jgi:pimeloyl-ACP methyl ester carboxylesterase